MAIAIIPARGGSKRIPHKNLKSFCGQPMIAYAINAAKNSGCFEQIVVSTDDSEIADVARSLGAYVPFLRSSELSDDYVGTTPVTVNTIERLRDEVGLESDHYCCIYATVPLLEGSSLRQGYEQLLANQADYVFSAAEFPFPIQRALRRDNDGFITPFHPDLIGQRSQDLEPAYQDAGQFYWGTQQAWLNGVGPFGGTGQALVLPRFKVVDIDTPEDWQLAELLYQALAHHD